MSSSFLFFKKWIKAPLQIGSIVPSSKKLTDTVINQITNHVNHNDEILLVGVGTGPLFKSVRESSINPEKIVSVELDDEMCNEARTKFPEFKIQNIDIMDFAQITNRKFHVVASSLPLTLMKNRNDVISAMLNLLEDTGVLIQYTYRFRSPIDIEHHNLEIKSRKRVYFNVPPAQVLVYRKNIS